MKQIHKLAVDAIVIDWLSVPSSSSGINLGKQIDDIYDGITVAGINCQPFRESYVKTRKVTCMVDSPGVNDFKEGPIVVKVCNDVIIASSSV